MYEITMQPESNNLDCMTDERFRNVDRFTG